MAVVGEHPDLADAGCHGCHLGKLLAFQPDGDSTDRVDVDQADFLTATPNMVGDDHGVGDRCGVRHGEHRREATQSCSCRACFDRLGVFSARLAKMRVEVDEAGQQDVTDGIDNLDIRTIDARTIDIEI